MVTHHSAEGYQDYSKLIATLDSKETIIAYFCGSVVQGAKSWCSDCNDAAPVVDDVLKTNTDKRLHFVHVGVGTRDEWKKPDCPFRTDPKLKLTAVPTMLLLNGVQRLTESECADRDNVELLLEAAAAQ